MVPSTIEANIAVVTLADPHQVAASYYKFAYEVGVKRLPGSMTAREYTSLQLAKLGLRHRIDRISWGTKTVVLPPVPEQTIQVNAE